MGGRKIFRSSTKNWVEKIFRLFGEKSGFLQKSSSGRSSALTDPFGAIDSSPTPPGAAQTARHFVCDRSPEGPLGPPFLRGTPFWGGILATKPFLGAAYVVLRCLLACCCLLVPLGCVALRCACVALYLRCACVALVPGKRPKCAQMAPLGAPLRISSGPTWRPQSEAPFAPFVSKFRHE